MILVDQRKNFLFAPLNRVNFQVALAPMVGLSHSSFKKVLSLYVPQGAQLLWPTEMLNSRRLIYQDLNTHVMTKKNDFENIICPQILANDEKFISLSIQKLQDWGASAIDINMGCSVTQALKHNYGVSLMGDSSYASRIVEMAKKYAQVPVSVKLRSGFEGHTTDQLIQFIGALKNAGVDWVTLHPRYAEQKRRGLADWSQIKEVKMKLDLNIIGNGDIQTAQDIESKINQSGCDMVMVGRALAARPWLIWQWGYLNGWPPPVAQGLNSTPPMTPIEEGAEYLKTLQLLYQFLLEDETSVAMAVKKLIFYLRTTHVWLDFGHRLYSDITGVMPNQIEGIIKKYQEHYPLRMSQKTDLR